LDIDPQKTEADLMEMNSNGTTVKVRVSWCSIKIVIRLRFN